ncbi:glycosyltransferase [Egbenema bharatensis]|uniref:glycosyltransferase n=1 Tax=Egbenema bharatensis TaxID=3463334 RepID=UPI003A87C7BE
MNVEESKFKPVMSVLICTHNPREDYIARVLQALAEQTLSKSVWELILIDNASHQPLSSIINLGWHPLARYVREEKLGLTPARLRGIEEARSDLLVFVDDDNVLKTGYLEITLEISKEFSMLGAWGGQIIPEFEASPPDWLKTNQEILGYLACRIFDENKWSNLVHEYRTTPCGAGLCVRRAVARKYAELVLQDSQRSSLDRKGKDLSSCGDYDLAFTACDVGLGVGKFASLKLTHLIPPERLQENYLLQLVERVDYSIIMLEFLRERKIPRLNWRSSKIYSFYIGLRYGFRESRFYEASQRGKKLAIKELSRLLS